MDATNAYLDQLEQLDTLAQPVRGQGFPLTFWIAQFDIEHISYQLTKHMCFDETICFHMGNKKRGVGSSQQ